MIFFKKSILKTHSLSVRQCAFCQERRRRICSDNRGTEGLPLQRKKKKHSRWKKPTAAMILPIGTNLSQHILAKTPCYTSV